MLCMGRCCCSCAPGTSQDIVLVRLAAKNAYQEAGHVAQEHPRTLSWYISLRKMHTRKGGHVAQEHPRTLSWYISLRKMHTRKGGHVAQEHPRTLSYYV